MFVIAALLIVTPFLVRDTAFTDASFTHQRIQSYDSFLGEDSLVSGLRYVQTPYDVIISFLPYPNALPLLFGLLSLGIGFLLIRKHPAKQYMFIVAVLTPTLVAASTFNNPFSFVLLLLLASIYIYPKTLLGSSICLLLLSFFSLPIFLASVAIFLAVLLKRKALLCVSLPLLVALFLFAYNPHLPVFTFTLTHLITEFGSVQGVGIFGLVLGVVGWLQYWKEAKKQLLLVLLLFLGTVTLPELTYFLLPVVAFFGGMALYNLHKQKWSLPLLKTLTIFVLVLGLIFSALAFQARMPSIFPSEEFVEGMDFLQEQESGVVLSHPSRGAAIASLAEQPVLLTNNRFVDARSADATTLFHSYDVEVVRSLLKTYSISYIVIDTQMIHGLEWEKDNQELVFLLKNDDSFKEIYANDGLTIWFFEEPVLGE